MLTNKLYALLLLLLFHSVSWGDEIDFNNIKVHGLYLSKGQQSDHTYRVLRDKQDFLWIASDYGLKRYNGYELTVFTHDVDNEKSIAYDSISELIYQDQQLWIGGNEISLYNPEYENFTNYNVSDHFAIYTMIKQGNLIWFGGEGYGLRAFDIESEKVVYQYLDSPEHKFVYKIIADNQDNKFWVATNSGISLVDADSGQKIEHLKINGIASGETTLYDLVLDDNNRLWIATSKGLISYNTILKTQQIYTHQEDNPQSISENVVTSLFIDKYQRLWVGTDKKGLNIYSPIIDGFQQISSTIDTADTHHLPSMPINDIFQDKYQSYWIAGSQGVYRISPHLERFDTLRHDSSDPNSISFDNILGLHESFSGDIWIATDGGGLNRYNPVTKVNTRYVNDPTNPNSLCSNSVIAVTQDNASNIWIGTYGGGLCKLSLTTNTFTHYTLNTQSPEHSLAGEHIFKILINSNQQIMLSVWRKGLQILDPETGTFTSYFPVGAGKESGISNFSINDIVEDSDGSFWIGGYNGLEHFDPNSQSFTPVSLHSTDSIIDIYLDDNNQVWAASTRGLIIYNKETKKVVRYTTEHGLPTDYIVSIEKDKNGLFWLGTRDGLVHFEPHNKKFTSLTQSDGLTGKSFNRNSHLQTNEGLMYFGGSNGLNIFDPQQFSGNVHQPQIILYDFKVLQQPILLMDKADAVTPHYPEQKFSYLQDDISISFAGLDFIAPMNNLYRYQLTGVDKQWYIANAKQRTVRYTNLAPGEYIFQVTAANNEGVWNSNVTQFKFIIEPPWWQTLWASILFMVLFLTAIYLFIFWRVKDAKAHARKLESKVKKRTKELVDTIEELEKTEHQLVESEKMASIGRIVSGVAHELNTPLGNTITAISCVEKQTINLIDNIENKSLSQKGFQLTKDKLTQAIDLSTTSIARLADLINRFKELAVDKQQEQVSYFSINTVLDGLHQRYVAQMIKENISFTMTCSTVLEINSYHFAFENTIEALMTNSLLHGFKDQPQGNISLEIATNDTASHLVINYCDDGVGICKKIEPFIFEPFTTTNRIKGNVGLGLNISYNTVTQLLQGTITLVPTDKGCAFEITLPLTISG